MDVPAFFGERVNEIDCRTTLRLHRNLTNARPALTKQIQKVRHPKHAITTRDQLHMRQPVRTHSGSGHIRGLPVSRRIHGQHHSIIIRNRGTRIDAASPHFRIDERNDVSRDPLTQDLGTERSLGHAVNIRTDAHHSHRPIPERRIRLTDRIGIIHRALVRRRPLEIAERSVLLAISESLGGIHVIGQILLPGIHELPALVDLLAKRDAAIIARIADAPQLGAPDRLRGLAYGVPAVVGMLLAQLVEHHTGSALRSNVLIGTDDISRLRAGDDRLLAVSVHEFLRHRGEIRNHQIRFLIGRRLGIAPFLDLIVRALRIVQRLRRTDHQKLHGRHPVGMLVGIDEQPPCGQNAHQRGLAILAGHKHDYLTETIAAILQQFQSMDEQPLLPRVEMHVQHDLRERYHRETITRLPRQRTQRRSEDARQGHTMRLIVDGTENLKILNRHRTPPSRNAS
nr:MAG: terminase large subunit [Caudoviricetes sp.]